MDEPRAILAREAREQPMEPLQLPALIAERKKASGE
jgi:hypothetical protein